MSRTRGSNGALSSNAILEKDKFEEVIRHRFFYALSSEIYGGVAGLYDLGPVGSALESQIIDAWRKHFVYKDGLLEVRSCQLTPYQTLEASGHVDRFTDVLVKDILTGESFRCDHLIKAYFEDLLQDKKLNEEKKTEYINIINQIDNIKKDEMKNIIEKYNISSPITKNKLSQPTDINLMFSTSIGPVDGLSGFLRPETAQGIFVNFKRLLEFNNNRIPMAVAQIGFSFRNEISPRAGLLRCREFLMAEIEHFLHPDKKCHPKFKTVENLNIKLYSAENQLNNNSQQTITLGHAVEKKIIANNVLGYYMGKIYLFLQKIGMDMQRVRFRQHLPNEMAHYACDCWDCEIHSFHGWVECVGCADRACYDLVQHSTKSKQKLIAQENLTTPILIKVHEIVLDKPAIGVRFKGEAKKIIPHIQSFTLEQAEELDETLNNQGFYGIQIDGIQFNLEKNMFKSINFYKKEVFVREYYPHVVEPSFGIGRIMYSLLTHTCKVRENDQQRIVLIVVKF
ncbi:hypothetical protein HZS_2481 [Henneguya salminicola]|uniref:glycine--tRNA ligase n=1 Tax=Henneguya salminicola TaxID=69463 RepID=A0A6G3MDW9_HENSL|nr:hypothetical protein HZS_2481 [Henneguya salminicola]